MGFLRAFLHDHRQLAIWLVALALCMKAIVPAGFMIDGAGKTLTITICGQGAPEHVVVPASGKTQDGPGEQGHASDACPFGALAMAALAHAPAALLALVLAFIVARGYLPVASPPPVAGAFLRPPLRAPPIPG